MKSLQFRDKRFGEMMLQMVETRNKGTRNKGIMLGEMMLQMVETRNKGTREQERRG